VVFYFKYFHEDWAIASASAPTRPLPEGGGRRRHRRLEEGQWQRAVQIAEYVGGNSQNY
jgi:hypothetical protein